LSDGSPIYWAHTYLIKGNKIGIFYGFPPIMQFKYAIIASDLL